MCRLGMCNQKEARTSVRIRQEITNCLCEGGRWVDMVMVEAAERGCGKRLADMMVV